MEPVKVGIVGSGFISGRYLENSLTFNSFDVWGAQLPWILVFGILGSLSVPDTFGGPVKVYIPEFKDWRVMPKHGYTFNSRGLGVADVADTLRSKRPHRAN